MLRFRSFHWCIAVTTLAGALAQAQAPLSLIPKAAPLVLAGGTIVDVSDWGHSAKDISDAVVVIRDGRIAEAGSRMAVTIPKGARVIDCTGKYLIPGLVDGFAGMNSQGQASAYLYMGVTSVVGVSDSRRGFVDQNANPSPHLYLLDSVGTTDNWSLLGHRGRAATRQAGGIDWAAKLKEGARRAELSPEDTAHQLTDLSRLGVRALYLGHNLTAANSQWIIAHAHQIGLATYGDFVSTPYKVGIEAGVDALVQMGRYELGAIPDELQKPLVEDPEGAASITALDYSQRIPPVDIRLRNYAKLIASHHAALMPALSVYFLQLPGHRNLWKEPAAALLDPAQMSDPPSRETGELEYPLTAWSRRLPGMTQRWLEEGQRKKADQTALRLWQINEAIFASYPHYLAASGALVQGSMPGISLHTELELLVRLGLSPREALAAATNNYALQFGWNELGAIVPGRRADILVVDGDPTASIWNARRISTLLMDGNVVDREGLLNLKR
jgi:hypothetical protein